MIKQSYLKQDEVGYGAKEAMSLKEYAKKLKQKRNSGCQVEQKVSNNGNERKRGLTLNSWP